MKIKVLVVQSSAVAGDMGKNIEKISGLLKSCGQTSADMIIFPELWTTGWDCPKFNKYSEEICKSRVTEFIKNTAKEFRSNVIGGSAILKSDKGKDRNTCLISDRNGELKGRYDKYHLFSHRGQSEGKYLEQGDNGLLINTDIGKIGISICYDVRFPELFRKYAFSGADLIVNMAAWPKPFYGEYETLIKARAIENQIYVISSCLTGKINEEFYFSGGSFISDYQGKKIASLNDEEAVLQAEIDLDEMKNYRLQMPVLNDCKKEYKIKEI